MPRRPAVAIALFVACWILPAVWSPVLRGAEPGYHVGIAKLDVTPNYPVRLSGYGNRLEEASEVAQRLHAKALAIRSGDAPPVVMITVDSLGVSADMTEAVATRLAKHGVVRAGVAICASHTHSAPALEGVAPLILTPPVPDDHREHVARYTKELTQQLGDVAETALKAMEPATLAYGYGTVKFAVNRRLMKNGLWSGFGVVPDAAVDHTLPVLIVRDLSGATLRAVLVNYACHCTTLGGTFQKIHGDWAGCAQEQIEREHPGCTAMVSIGCGADANPNPRGDDLALTLQHGDEIAREVKRLLVSKQGLTALAGPITTKRSEFALPLRELPSKEEYDRRAAMTGPIARHAALQLERLARGEALPTTVPYSAQSWSFGDSLAMVFLPGEVVVDYQHRLKYELDPKRLWINAYSNSSPCYIASARVIAEGGYEVENSMYYYDQPTRLSPAVEDLIVGRVLGSLTKAYLAPQRFAADVAKIEARDRENPPPAEGVLFIGSSSIRMWDLKKWFPSFPAVNHGFGGSQISDVLYYFDRLVTPLKPRQIVFYCGANDIAAGKTPERVAHDFATFVERVRKELPQTKITFIALAPSVKRWNMIEAQRRTNKLIEAEIRSANSPLLEFVPVEKRLLGSDGQPQPHLYLKDMLHFNEAGYAILSDIVMPQLR